MIIEVFHAAGPVPITPAFYKKEDKFSIGAGEVISGNDLRIWSGILKSRCQDK
ncbi:MAG: hypothetical protein PVF66_00020 [Candidatus Aminicenantes bacterium]|jgi:hypothetical protein